MGDGPDPDDRIRAALDELVAGVHTGDGPPLGTLVGRVRTRRRKRRVAVVGVLGSLLLFAVLGALASGTRNIEVTTPPAGGAATGAAAGSGADPDGTTGGWRWVDLDGVVARDGSRSGYAIRRVPSSTGLVIVLGDGVPCLDAASCAQSTSSFGPADLQRLVRPGGAAGGAPLTAQDGSSAAVSPQGTLVPGSLDRPESPFADVNLVWVPQVTGDMHLGTRHDGAVAGLADPQQFLGAANFSAVLADVTSTGWAAGLDRVVLMGSGTGGFGALGNYPALEETFGDVQSALLVDSALWFHEGEVLRRCEANTWIRTWGLERPPGWPAHLASGPRSMGNVYSYLADRYPASDLVLMATVADPELMDIYRHRSPGCEVPAPGTGPGTYVEAAHDLVGELEALSPWRVLLVDEPGSRRPLTALLEDPAAPANDPARVLVEDTIGG